MLTKGIGKYQNRDVEGDIRARVHQHVDVRLQALWVVESRIPPQVVEVGSAFKNSKKDPSNRPQSGEKYQDPAENVEHPADEAAPVEEDD